MSTLDTVARALGYTETQAIQTLVDHRPGISNGHKQRDKQRPRVRPCRTAAHRVVLSVVDQYPGLTSNQISVLQGEEDLRKTTPVLSELVHAGLVDREPRPDNPNQYRNYRITDKGKKHLTELVEASNAERVVA